MTKLDFLMIVLGIASYVAIMVDMRTAEQRLKEFEENSEKRRIYLQHIEQKRREETAKAKALEKKMAAKAELNQMAAEKLGASDI